MRTASLFLCAAALAGCAPLSQAFRSLPAAPPAGRNVTFYRIVYNFKGAPDGAAPLASLLFVHNKFYGTTLLGGDRRCAPAGCGVVFETTVDGVERVLYRFAGGTDGAYPVAELTASGTLLYGTTTAGGARCDAPGRCGTIFTISPSGDERILHRFKGGRDGASPYGGLTPLGGNFYGSTYAGGGGGDCSQRGSGCGTIFIAGKEGTERVLYAFKGGSDGANPDATLFAYDDALYGTTESGGSRCGTGHGCGVAFSASTSGGEHVLHRFDGSPDGQYPDCRLLAIDSTFYGTTQEGGADYVGTVFTLAPGGREDVIYSFANGGVPQAGLTSMDGHFYGTTSIGGTNGWGTVFEIDRAGRERVVYSFKGGKDGAHPQSRLIAVNGVLYGTTLYGGAHRNGTIFAIIPRP